MQISTYIHVQTWKSEKSEVKLSQKQITVVAETHVDFVRVGYIYIDTYIIIHTFIKDKRRHTSFLQCGSWWLNALNCFQFGRFSVFQSNPAGENSVAPIWWCKIVLKISFSIISPHFPLFQTMFQSQMVAKIRAQPALRFGGCTGGCRPTSAPGPWDLPMKIGGNSSPF
jgi:hypothetical protein